MASFLPPEHIGGLRLPHRTRSPSRHPYPSQLSVSTIRPGSKLLWIQGARALKSKLKANLGGDVPPVPDPAKSKRNLWGYLWFLLTVIIPFWKTKWDSFLNIEEEVESKVETVAKMVEEAAEVTEKMSEDLAKELPDGSKLKEAVLFVETTSKEAEKDAELTLSYIKKIDEVKHEVTTQVNVLLEQGIHKTKDVESTVEGFAKFVEEAAEVAEKVSEEVAKELPEGSKLKEAALFVDTMSKEGERDAELTLSFVQKVDEFQQEVKTEVEKGKQNPSEKQA